MHQLPGRLTEIPMQRISTRMPIWLTTLVVWVLLVGCAAPMSRQVQAVDSSENTVKFLFDERNEDGEWERGLLECEIEGGELENCRHIDVEYQ